MNLYEFLSSITVEPTMILYMMAFMITTVLEQAFFVEKACTSNYAFNRTVCDHLTSPEYEDLNKQVQLTVAQFHLINDIAGHVGPIILSFFLGAWSDRRGRKLPLLIGLFGKFYYTLLVIVNALQPTWPLEYVVYTATLPMAFTGADVAIFASAFTYLVDVTTPESRTMRVTILEVCYLTTMPTGIALGSYLFRNYLDRSYARIFVVNAILMLIAILYSAIRLEWRTNPRQKPLSEASNIFTDFFDRRHLTATCRTLFKKRPANRRCYLLFLILSMAAYTFQRDEKSTTYLYAQLVLKWSWEKFSQFRTFQSATQDVVLLLAIPLFSKVLGWRDTWIAMIGASAHACARAFFANAQNDWLFYSGGLFAAIGPIVAPVIRSMVSKLVANTEKGKAFAMLSVADNAIPLISSTLYSKVYQWTIHDHPNLFFYLTMITQLVVLLIFIYIHVRAKDEDLIHEDEDVKQSCLEDGPEIQTN